MPAPEDLSHDPLTLGSESRERARFVGQKGRRGRRRGGRVRRWLKRLAIGGVCFLAVLATALWFARGWLMAKAIELVDSELSKRGIYLRWESAQYGALRGLVLEDVALCESADKRVPLLRLDNVGIRVGLGDLIKDRSVERVNASVTVRDAELEFLHGGRRVLLLSGLDLDAGAGVKGIDLESARFSAGDLAVALDGNIAFARRAAEAKPDPGEAGKREPLEIDFSPLELVTPWLDFVAGDKGGPELQATLAIAAGKVTVEGKLSGDTFRYRGVPLDSAGITFGFDGAAGEVTVPTAAIGYRGARVGLGELKLVLAAGDLSFARFESSADLPLLVGEFAPEAREALAAVRFHSPPAIRASGQLSLASPLEGRFVADLGGVGDIGVAVPGRGELRLAKPAGEVVWEDGEAELDGFRVELWGGSLRAEGTTTPPLGGAAFAHRGEVWLQGIGVAELLAFAAPGDPPGFVGKFDLRYAGSLVADPAKLTGEGEVAWGDPQFRLAGPYRIAAGVVSTERLSAAMEGGGAAALVGTFDFAAEPPAFTAKARVADVPLATLAGLAGIEEPPSGTVQFAFDGSGTTDLADLGGRAEVRVTEGQLYRVPLIGRMHGLLANIAPLFGRKRQEALSASFQIEAGVAHTDDFLLAGDGTLIHLRGDFDLGQQVMDLIAYLTLDGAVGLATGVVTRLVEIRGRGPFGAPKLTLNRNPKDLAFNAFGGALDLAQFGVETIGGKAFEFSRRGAGAALDLGKLGAGAVLDLGKLGAGAARGVGGAGAGALGGARKVGEGAVGGARKVGEGARDAVRGVLPGRREERKETEDN